MPNEGKQLNKRGHPRRTNVGLDRVSLVPLDQSMDDIQTNAWTCRKACKDAIKQRKPNKWHKASKACISALHRAGKGVSQPHQHHKGVSHKWSNKPQEGWMQPHKQVGPKIDTHKSAKGKKYVKA